MAIDLGTWISALQFLKQEHERSLLRLGTCVLRCLAVFGNATDVAHADRVAIVPRAMRSDNSLAATAMDGSVYIYNIMVAHVLEATLLVPRADIAHSRRAALRRRRTVDDDLIDCSHLLPPPRLCYH